MTRYYYEYIFNIDSQTKVELSTKIKKGGEKNYAKTRWNWSNGTRRGNRPLCKKGPGDLFQSKFIIKYRNNQFMSRPRLCRKIKFNPDVTYFKPRGVPMRFLEVIKLTLEEVEALRLKNIEDLEQTKCAKKMNTSQSTFQRILSSAYKKISVALINGKAIEITNENIKKEKSK